MRQKKNLVLDMLNQVYSYLQGPVPKMWTIHTATHALKLLTELKEYTDMKKIPIIATKEAGQCAFPQCASSVLNISTAAS